MWRQVFRPTAAILSALLVTSAPALAGTVRFADVSYAGGTARSASDVRLRVAGGPAAGQTAQAQGQTASTPSAQQPSDAPAAAAGQPVSGQGDGTLTQGGGAQVETVDLGDVTGTVCDCGEIPAPFKPAAGGIPWWPLLGAAALPFLFGGGDDDTSLNPNPTPNPTPPPPAIPEPATLLLFGTGLLAVGARARRRYSNRHALADTANAAGEV